MYLGIQVQLSVFTQNMPSLTQFFVRKATKYQQTKTEPTTCGKHQSAVLQTVDDASHGGSYGLLALGLVEVRRPVGDREH